MNLLPKEEKEILRSGFKMRIFVLLNIFLSIFFLFATIFLSPSYFLAREQLRLVSSSNTSLKPEDEDSINKSLLVPVELGAKVRFFENNIKNKSAYEAVSEVVALKNPGIKINALTFSKVAEGGESKVLMLVSGQADKRESLINFQTSLQDSGWFESVNVPVSSLAKEKDLPFSIDLIILREPNEKLDS